jgi:hypothetical protein
VVLPDGSRSLIPAVGPLEAALDNERAATEQKQIAQQQRDRAEKTLAAASRPQ